MRVIGKTLLWGVIVLVLVGVGLPGAIGFYVARQFDYAVANLTVPGTLEVADSDFQRGWFSSTATIALRPVGALCVGTVCPVMSLDSTIYHGPLAFGAQRRDSLRPVLAVVDTRADPTALWPRYVFSPVPGPITLHARVGLDTRGHVSLRLAGLSFDVTRQAPIAHVDSATLDGQLDTTIAGRAISGIRLSWPSFGLAPQTGGRLAWRGLDLALGDAVDKTKVSADRHESSVGHLGRVRLQLDSLTLDNGQGQATRLNDLDVQLHRPTADGAHFTLAARQVVLPDNTRGELHLDVAASGINLTAWTSLPSQWHALGGLAGGAADDPRFYHDVLPSVLTPGFDFRVARAALYTEDGPLRLRGHIASPNGLVAGTMAADTVRQLDIELALSVPQNLARRLARRQIAAERGNDLAVDDRAIEQHLASLVQRGLLSTHTDDSGYDVTLRVHEGRLLLNGRTQPGWQSVVDQLQATAQGL